MSIFEKINLYVMLTMQDDYIEDEEVLAYTCQLHVNQNMHNIHAAFNKFEAYVANKHPKLSISNIYNRYVYNWFHGNSSIVLLVKICGNMMGLWPGA